MNALHVTPDFSTDANSIDLNLATKELPPESPLLNRSRRIMGGTLVGLSYVKRTGLEGQNSRGQFIHDCHEAARPSPLPESGTVEPQKYTNLGDIVAMEKAAFKRLVRDVLAGLGSGELTDEELENELPDSGPIDWEYWVKACEGKPPQNENTVPLEIEAEEWDQGSYFKALKIAEKDRNRLMETNLPNGVPAEETEFFEIPKPKPKKIESPAKVEAESNVPNNVRPSITWGDVDNMLNQKTLLETLGRELGVEYLNDPAASQKEIEQAYLNFLRKHMIEWWWVFANVPTTD